MLTIRRAQAGDRRALIDLLRENEMDHADPITDYLLAVQGEDLLGCIRLEEFENVSMIRPVVVAERHRKKGIGRLLIESLPPSNKPKAVAARGDAVRFYETLGFLKTTWAHLPTRQEEECGSCPDQEACQPQPMKQELPTWRGTQKGKKEMKTKKHALVLFSKYPEPGATKTRLMEENGGTLTAQEAADLYKAMVLDTATVGCHALKASRSNGFNASFDFYVSTSPATQLPGIKAMFEEALPGEEVHYMVDRGENFDEHFNDCYRQLFKKGYDSVVCIGGDMPAMTPDLVERAFKWLVNLEKDSAAGAMVLAPCQAGGVSLVGVTQTADMDFSGVFYNTGGVTALDALINIAQRKNVPTALFEALSDVDLMEDLAHMITVINAMAYAARFQPEILVPERTLAFIRQVGLVANTPPNTAHDPRSAIDG